VIQSAAGVVQSTTVLPHAGFSFAVRNNQGQIVATITTDTAGHAQTGSLISGSYSITETDALGLTDLTQQASVTLTTGTQTVTWINQQAPPPVVETPEVGGAPTPSIDIELHTNDVDADLEADAVQLMVDDPIRWTYIVTNTGPVDLTGITVIDTGDGQVIATDLNLAAGESAQFTASGTATEGVASRTATVATAEGVTDADPTWYLGIAPVAPPQPEEPTAPLALQVNIELLTNNIDADTIDQAVRINLGDEITWTYLVTNMGERPLSNVAIVDHGGTMTDVTDDIEIASGESLAPGESMSFTRIGTGEIGIFEVIATVTTAENVSDVDPSFHLGGAPAPSSFPNTGNGGLAPEASSNSSLSWVTILVSLMAGAMAVASYAWLRRRDQQS